MRRAENWIEQGLDRAAKEVSSWEPWRKEAYDRLIRESSVGAVNKYGDDSKSSQHVRQSKSTKK